MERCNNTIGEKIKLLRTLKKLSQEELSNLSGITISSIKKYECGIRNPKKEQLSRIAEVLGVSTNTFLEFDLSTTEDILFLITSIDNQGKINWSFKYDADGNIFPNTISMSFNCPAINDALSEYLKDNNVASSKPAKHTSKQLDLILRYMNTLISIEHHDK